MFQLIKSNYNSGISSVERERANLLLNLEKEINDYNERFWASEAGQNKKNKIADVEAMFVGYSFVKKMIKIFVVDQTNSCSPASPAISGPQCSEVFQMLNIHFKI